MIPEDSFASSPSVLLFLSMILDSRAVAFAKRTNEIGKERFLTQPATVNEF